jgi:hypothetical protein
MDGKMAKKKKAKPKKVWMWVPPKPEKIAAPENEKVVLEAIFKSFLEKMKPQWIQPPRKDFGYVSDVYGKWYRNYYYFCALYRYEDPSFISPEREIKFARLEYAGPGHFHLSYFRHTGQWFQVFENLPLEECLDQVANNPIFMP